MAYPKETGIPLELAEKATEAMARAIEVYKIQSENMKEETAEFERKKKEIEERIRRGARRSNGPIV